MAGATAEVQRTSGRGMSRASGLTCAACGGLPNLKVKAKILLVPMGERTDTFLRYPCESCKEPVDVKPDQIRKLVRVSEVGKLGNAVDRIDDLMDKLEASIEGCADGKELASIARAFASLAKDKPAIIKALEEDRKEEPQQVLYGDVVMTEGGPIHRTLERLARAVASGEPLGVKDADFTPPGAYSPPVPPPIVPSSPAEESIAW